MTSVGYPDINDFLNLEMAIGTYTGNNSAVPKTVRSTGLGAIEDPYEVYSGINANHGTSQI